MLNHVSSRALRAYIKFLPFAIAAASFAGCKCPPGTADLADTVEKIAAENAALRAHVAAVEPDEALGKDFDGIKAGRNDAAVRSAKQIAEACR